MIAIGRRRHRRCGHRRPGVAGRERRLPRVVDRATLLTLAAIPYGKRRPIGTPFSWGEAMLGATYAFGVMFLAFGVVPHQWIDHADKNLGWNRTRIVYGPGGILKPQSLGGWNPITLQYEAIRDIVVVVIHVYFFGLLIFIWMWWQKRGQTTTTGDRDEHATAVRW